MDPAALDIGYLIANAPLAGAVIYLFKELQKVHAENAKRTAEHLKFLQQMITSAGGGHASNDS